MITGIKTFTAGRPDHMGTLAYFFLLLGTGCYLMLS